MIWRGRCWLRRNCPGHSHEVIIGCNRWEIHRLKGPSKGLAKQIMQIICDVPQELLLPSAVPLQLDQGSKPATMPVGRPEVDKARCHHIGTHIPSTAVGSVAAMYQDFAVARLQVCVELPQRIKEHMNADILLLTVVTLGSL